MAYLPAGIEIVAEPDWLLWPRTRRLRTEEYSHQLWLKVTLYEGRNRGKTHDSACRSSHSTINSFTAWATTLNGTDNGQWREIAQRKTDETASHCFALLTPLSVDARPAGKLPAQAADEKGYLRAPD